MSEVQGKTYNYVLEKLQEIITFRIRQVIEEADQKDETLFEAAERIILKEMRQ